MMALRRAAVVAAVTALALAGCTGEASESSADEVTAVATTPQVADLVENVGGERVAVHRLLSPGTDPHSYEPRPSDAQAMAEAAVVFRSGGDLDQWLAELVENADPEAEVVTLLDSIAASGGGLADDPHWWQNPRNGVAAVRVISETLAAADPAGADTYRANARRYSRRLTRLDRRIARCFERVPRYERKLVTTHDSYRYFADRYDIEVVGALIPSRSTQAQPSAGETAELVQQIEREGSSAVFPESPLNPQLEQVVAEEAGAVIGDPLWGDSLGPEGTDGETYADALASDAAAMVEGFTAGARSCRAG